VRTAKSVASVDAPSAYAGVQALRGLAAAMVVAYHATQMWTQHVDAVELRGTWKNGAAGVEVFFIISGFVMAVSTIGREHKEHPARNFLQRRLVRLIPLYWIMTGVELAKIWFIRGHRQFANSAFVVATPWAYILCSLFFIPYKNSVGAVQPLLYVGWSLSFEMLFYLLFAVALAMRTDVARFLTPALIFLATVGLFRTDHWPAWSILTEPYLIEFLAGLLLGHAVLKGFRMNVQLAGLLGILGGAVLLCVPPPQNPFLNIAQWGVSAYLLVQAIVVTDTLTARLWPRWLLLLGDASYSLYLSHPLVFTFIVKLLARIGLLTPGAIQLKGKLEVLAISLPITFLVAVPLYLWVERPMTLWLRRNVLHENRLPVL